MSGKERVLPSPLKHLCRTAAGRSEHIEVASRGPTKARMIPIDTSSRKAEEGAGTQEEHEEELSSFAVSLSSHRVSS